MTFIYNNLPNLNINFPKLSFRANVGTTTPATFEPRKDSFNSNPLYDNFADKEYLTKLAKSSPRIMEILKEYKIPLNINVQELENLKKGHLLDTRITAAKIYSALPKELKSEINLADLQQAAMLHDYGKVLIPEKILYKNSSLSPEEKVIMEQHSELGYELLRQQGIKQNVLDLVKYHHQTPNKTGYPTVPQNYEHSLAAQILSTADKYSALKENRSYKDALPRDEILTILHEDVLNGVISPEIYNALLKIV